MKKILVVLDDESSNLLNGETNKSRIIRESIKLYKGHISTDTLDGIRASYSILGRHLERALAELAEVNSKLDYISKKVQ